MFWCFFLSFFSDKKIAFLVPFFKRCIMLTKNRWYLKNKFCYFSIRICTRVEKFLRNGHKKYVQKSICRNLFVQIRRALGNLRNFFGALRTRPYMLSQVSTDEKYIFLSSGKKSFSLGEYLMVFYFPVNISRM